MSEKNEAIDPDDMIIVYTTLGSVSDAEILGENLVERGLAACVNIFPGMQSIYEIDGEMEFDHEAAMIIKSRAALKTRLLEEAGRLHPYEIPALIVLETGECNQVYLDWVRSRTINRKGRGVN